MSFFGKRCAHPGCRAPAGRVRCQDCGRAFCAAHIAAIEFAGYRTVNAMPTAWTRFVCGSCADRADHALLVATANRERARSEVRSHWWESLRAETGDRR